MTLNRSKIILISVGLLLMIPLVAMQFTTEVNWSFLDFVAMGILLLVCGFSINFILQKTQTKITKIIAVGFCLLLFFLIWAELAVGIFGTPFAGN